MQLNEILKELNSIIDSGRKVPGFNGKMMIDSEKLSEIFRELSNSADAGLNEAQLIITQKVCLARACASRMQRNQGRK